MSAILTGMQQFIEGERAVLIRNAVTMLGTLVKVRVTMLSDNGNSDPSGFDDEWTNWALQLPDKCYTALHPKDTVYTSSRAPCFSCSLPIDDAKKDKNEPVRCAVCFDRYL